MPGSRPASAPPTFHLGYRPALDGLRAVAVVLVMVHHSAAFLWPSVQRSFATGGFLGVDVFFVLSGFLITVIVLAPRGGLVPSRSGDVVAPLPTRLGRFYLRRARRLLPALVVVLVFLAGCALVFHSPTAADLRATAAWVLTYSGNWGVLSTHRIAPEVSHTWSLAVEAQFYLVWPLVVIAVLSVVRGARGRVALAVVAVAGIAAVAVYRAHAWDQQHNALAVYVRTPARADALLVGCLAGLAVSSGWITGRAVAAWRAALVVGLVGVVALAWTVEVGDGALYNGLFTVVAVLAALAVLGALFAGDGFPVSRLLASGPFVAVGRWSYSLYLWHFPLFFLLHAHQPTWSPAVRTIVGWVLTFGVAMASYRFVERPFFRNRRGVAPAQTDPLPAT